MVQTRLNNRKDKDECVGASQGEQNRTEPVNTYLVPSSDSWFKLTSSLITDHVDAPGRPYLKHHLDTYQVISSNFVQISWRMSSVSLSRDSPACWSFSDLSLLQQKYYWRQTASILRFSEKWNLIFFLGFSHFQHNQEEIMTQLVVCLLCNRPIFFFPVIMETERDTGRHVTPGCLHPRSVASSHGESALEISPASWCRTGTLSTITNGAQKVKKYRTCTPSPWMSFEFCTANNRNWNYRKLQTRISHVFSPGLVWCFLFVFSSRRFLLPEYLPYAGIFHERGQPGLATHSSVNRVLAGKHTHTASKNTSQVWKSPKSTSQTLIRFDACCLVVELHHCSRRFSALKWSWLITSVIIIDGVVALLRCIDRGRSVCSRQQHR